MDIITPFVTEVASSKQLTLQILNVVAYLVLIAANGLSNLMPISQPEISDLSDALITPAGFAFAIWGVIYLLITGFVVY